MKSQFVRKPSQGQKSAEQLPAKPQASPSSLQHTPPLPPAQPPQVSGSGLLSNWKAGNSQDHLIDEQTAPLEAAQNQTQQRPMTGAPLSPSNHGFFPGQIQPASASYSQPGIAPSPAAPGGPSANYFPTSPAGNNVRQTPPANYQNNGFPRTTSNLNAPSLSGVANPGYVNPPSLSGVPNPGYPGYVVNPPSLSGNPGSMNASGTLAGPGYPMGMNGANIPGGPPYPNSLASPGGTPPGNLAPFKKRPRRRFPIWARILVAVLAVMVVGVGVAYIYYQANYAASVGNITGHQAIHHVTVTAGASKPTQAAANTGGALTGNRINILLLGSDTDGKGNDGISGSPLAQTDIVITIDPQSKQVGMLSIPRDMQVYIPGYGAGKMDAAFSYGYSEANSSDMTTSIESAAGLAEDTIAYNFGIHIDDYAWVGLSGFVKVIDTAGGVDIDAIHPMVDDEYPDDVNGAGDIYGYKRLYIAPGPQHMDGTQALEYVRTRHSDLIGDFGRSARQQQVLSQLKTKLATSDTIAKAPQLLSDLSNALKTNLDVTQIVQMANFARGIDTNSMQRITLGPPTYAYALSGNSGNYAPICDQVKTAIATMFAIQPTCIPQTADIGSSSTANSGLASAAPATSNGASASINTEAASVWQSLGQINQMGLLSLDHVTAVHSLLDLMFMVVFESFDAVTT